MEPLLWYPFHELSSTLKTFRYLRGQTGGSITIPCFYGQEHKNRVKSWCKSGNRPTCTSATKATQTKGTITDDPDNLVFLVTMKNLQQLDSGNYWCFVGEGRTKETLDNSTLTAIRYRDEILGPIVRPYAGAVGPGFLLVHDNAQPYVARVCRQFLKHEGIDTIDRPPRLHDLNPIEHIMGHYVSVHPTPPDLGGDPPGHHPSSH
uniref:Ig-like domain-containing protein n=1 Tax=Paramormyrops kingsleyae TaxID=1676925 RepID=A0A3B3T048_9TELE